MRHTDSGVDIFVSSIDIEQFSCSQSISQRIFETAQVIIYLAGDQSSQLMLLERFILVQNFTVERISIYTACKTY